jgi:hypothetical protein
MVHFHSQNPNFCKTWLLYFMTICNIIRQFDLFYGHLVYFGGHLVHFSHFGFLYQVKSGNPGSPTRLPKQSQRTKNGFFYFLNYVKKVSRNCILSTPKLPTVKNFNIQIPNRKKVNAIRSKFSSLTLWKWYCVGCLSCGGVSTINCQEVKWRHFDSRYFGCRRNILTPSKRVWKLFFLIRVIYHRKFHNPFV